MIFALLLLGVTLNYYSESFNHIDSYRTSIYSPKNSFKLKKKDSNDKTLEELLYEPKVPSYSGVTLSAYNISLSAAYQNPKSENDVIEESEVFDIQLSGVFSKIKWDLYYQNYHGLYISENQNIDESNEKVASSYSYGLNLYYFTKDGYNPQQSLGDYNYKKKTDWSWVHGIFYNNTKLYSSKGLIPFEYRNEFSQLYGLTAIQSHNYGYNFGFSGMFNADWFYASMLFSYGLQFQNQNLEGLDEKERQLSAQNLRMLFDVGTSFIKHQTFGVNFYSHVTSHPIKDTNLEGITSNFEFYYKWYF